MKNIWKKIYSCIIVAISLLVLVWLTYAQNQCDSVYSIQWFENIKIWQTSYYTINNDKLINDNNINVSYKLLKDGKRIYDFVWEDFSYSFKSDWFYQLEANVSIGKCKYSLKKPIHAYNKVVLYVWTKLNELEIWFAENFQKHSILFHQVILSDKKFFFEDEISASISENMEYLIWADYMILWDNFDEILQIIWKISKTQKLEFKNKSIFVSTTINQNLIKRLLAKYVKLLSIEKLYILNNDYFLNFLSDISFDKDIAGQKYIKPFEMSFSSVPKYYIVSYFLDNLISNWFPVSLVWFMLLLIVAALVISVFRQIIWFSVFGIYSPILFAISMSVLGVWVTCILFSFALFSTIITRLFTSKISMLYTARITVLIILYFMFTILFLWLDKMLWLNLVDFSVFNNSFVIFPIVSLIVVWDKVFNEWTKLFSKTRLISFLEFWLVSGLVYMIIWRWALNYFMLSYPELMILILFLNILVWRFTWLQLLEYFRFIPLLKKWDEEE